MYLVLVECVQSQIEAELWFQLLLTKKPSVINQIG